MNNNLKRQKPSIGGHIILKLAALFFGITLVMTPIPYLQAHEYHEHDDVDNYYRGDDSYSRNYRGDRYSKNYRGDRYSRNMERLRKSFRACFKAKKYYGLCAAEEQCFKAKRQLRRKKEKWGRKCHLCYSERANKVKRIVRKIRRRCDDSEFDSPRHRNYPRSR